MKTKGNLIVISGPSGAGKGTLVAQLLERVPSTWISISATTRKPRPGEQDGVHYYFLEKDRFMEIAAQGGFLEWAQVHGNCYGTPMDKVKQRIAEGKQVILEIDVQGALQVKKKMPEAKTIFVLPPSFEILEKRLRGRGTESEDVIATRMSNAQLELSLEKEYDYSVVNDELDRAVNELVALVESISVKED